MKKVFIFSQVKKFTIHKNDGRISKELENYLRGVEV